MKRREVAREQLQKLRDRGLTRQQIADTLGTSLSTVKRLLAEHGLTNKRSPRRGDAGLGIVDERSPEAGRTLLERARMRLGDRVRVTARGYTLDDRPVTVFDLLKEAGLSHPE